MQYSILEILCTVAQIYRRIYLYKTDVRANRKWILYTAKCLLNRKLRSRETWQSILYRRAVPNTVQTRRFIIILYIYKTDVRANRKWILYMAKCLITGKYAVERRDYRSCIEFTDAQYQILYICADIYNYNIYRADVQALRKWFRHTAKCLLVGNYAVERRDGRSWMQKLYRKLAKSGFLLQIWITSE
jgi:hypothetical protein